jgi:hypothetical protein
MHMLSDQSRAASLVKGNFSSILPSSQPAPSTIKSAILHARGMPTGQDREARRWLEAHERWLAGRFNMTVKTQFEPFICIVVSTSLVQAVPDLSPILDCPAEGLAHLGP